MLTHQWQEDRISDGLYFANVEKLEGRIRELTNERNATPLSLNAPLPT
jgi:hypothetical protein